MPYDKATPEIKQTLHLTGQIPKYLKDQKIAGIDLMKVVALMRIIDGCDSQNRRAGSSDRVRMTIAMLRRDGDTAAKRALAAYEAAVEVGQVDGLVKPGSGCKGGVSDPDRSKRIQHLKTANTLASRLWLLAAEALDQSAMKNAQEEHYAKHTFVDEIEIELQEGFSDENLAFRILLHQSATWKQEWPMADEPSTMQLVYDEVSGEYECVKDDASSRMKLGIDYKWA